MNKLYVVPTPIGNLTDFTLRSIEVLKSVKYLLCEDTLVSGKIKKHLDLDVKLISLHKFNEASRVNEVMSLLTESDVALVSDAGTPTISDPGQLLIKELVSEGVEVIPLAGANAITVALSGSGLEFSNFSFLGFLPKEKSKVVSTINKHINNDVLVAYESPNRIVKTLTYIMEEFGDIYVVVARELTKMYEEFSRGKVSELINREYKGEIVLLIPTVELSVEDDLAKHIDSLLKIGLSNKDIISYLTENTKFKKNDIYNILKEK